MSFTEPQAITIGATPFTLPRTGSGPTSGLFQTADGAHSFSILQNLGKRNRRTIRFTHTKYAPDPLFPTQNTPFSMTFYVTVDVPRLGYSIVEQKSVVDGVLANLQAGTGANITKLLGGEN